MFISHRFSSAVFVTNYPRPLLFSRSIKVDVEYTRFLRKNIRAKKKVRYRESEKSKISDAFRCFLNNGGVSALVTCLPYNANIVTNAQCIFLLLLFGFWWFWAWQDQPLPWPSEYASSLHCMSDFCFFASGKSSQNVLEIQSDSLNAGYKVQNF